jgi:hypothetical protein
MRSEVRRMLGIGIPTFTPGSAGSGEIWSGVVAGIALAVVLVASVWTHLRTRPVRHGVTDVVDELPQAA